MRKQLIIAFVICNLLISCSTQVSSTSTQSQADNARVSSETTSTDRKANSSTDGLISEKSHDMNCVSDILGDQRTDQILTLGGSLQIEELSQVSECEWKGETGSSQGKYRPSSESRGSQSVVTESTHDVNCVSGVLGRKTADDIIYRGQSPTSGQMSQIANCELRSQHPLPEDVNPDEKRRYAQNNIISEDSHDIDCLKPILGASRFDHLLYGGGKPTEDELAATERCKVFSIVASEKGLIDHIPNGSVKCDGNDMDESGLALSPKCNVLKEPLPEGVYGSILIEAKLPNPRYHAPVEGCQKYENGQCVDLSWEPLADVMAGEFVQIKISPTNPNVMYAGVDSNDMTMYRSTDGGNSWDLVNVVGHAAGLTISPSDPNIVLYTNLEAPVQRTVDGGEKWQAVLGNDPESGNYNNPFTAIAFSPDDPSVVYASGLLGSNRGYIWPPEPAYIYKSVSAGKDWKLAGICQTCSSVQSIVVKEGDPNFIWVAADGGVQYSEDGGQSWSGNLISYLDEQSLKYSNENRPPKVIGLATQPGNPATVLAASSEYGMFRTEDEGVTWSRVNNGINSLQLHQVHFAPSNPNVAYVTSHNGIYRTSDAGHSWTYRSDGLNYEFFTPIAIHPLDEDVVFVGTATEVYTVHPEHKNRGMHMGEGLYKTTDGGKSWNRSDSGIIEAKIAQIGTHPILPFNIWVGGESGRGNFFSPDAGGNWLFSPSVTSHYPMVYAFSYDFPTIIYTTGWLKTGELMASTDGGASWYTLTRKLDEGLSEATRNMGLRTEGSTDFHIHAVAVAPSDSDVVYVGSVHDTVYPNLTFNLSGAHIWKSSDGGETFPEMSEGFPIETKTSVNSIVIHPNNPDVAYAMTSLHESQTAIGIYKTINGARSWFPANEGLDVFTNDVQMDSINPDILYAATESGVYKTVDGASSWYKTSEGIPKGAVIDLAIDPLNPQVLYAITADNLYRTQNGAGEWHTLSFGIPLLEDSSKPLSAQERLLGRLRLDRTKTGHSEYGGTFAQDRTLEIDSTGRFIVVAAKTERNDRNTKAERLLYGAVTGSLVDVEYNFIVTGQSITVVSQSNVYDLVLDTNVKEIRFNVGGPTSTDSKTQLNIPKSMLEGPFKVLVDGKEIEHLSIDSGVIFNHTNSGTSKIIIKGS